jgi:hypothetical protein
MYHNNSMLINREDDSKFLIEMSEKERNAIVNSNKYIIVDLGEDELQTRTGFEMEEYENLSRIVSQSLNPIDLDEDRLVMLHQALNEVGNGIDIPLFELQIGVPRTEIIEMLNTINEKLDLL